MATGAVPKDRIATVVKRERRSKRLVLVVLDIPIDRSINDFDLATFHQWLISQGYKGLLSSSD